MNALLRHTRVADRATVTRAVVPLIITVIALLIHLGIEFSRSRVAALGVTFDSDVQPAAVDFLAAVRAETSSRFSVTSTTYGGIAVTSADNIVTSDSALAAKTNAKLAKFLNVVSSLRSRSTDLADSKANLDSCIAPDCGSDAINAQLQALRSAAATGPILGSYNAVMRILIRTLYGSFIDSAAVLKSTRLLYRLAAPYAELLTTAHLETSSLRALFNRAGSFSADTAADSASYNSIPAFVAARAQLRYLLSFSKLPFGLANPAAYSQMIAIATAELAQADAILTANSDVLQTSTLPLTLIQINDISATTANVITFATAKPTTYNAVEERGLYVVIGVAAGTLLCLLVAVLVSHRHLAATSKSTRILDEFSRTEEIKAVAKAYLPAISLLRTDLLPKDKPKNEVARVYDDIARLVLEIRPFLPQTLFGMFVDEQRDPVSSRKLAAASAAAGIAADTTADNSESEALVFMNALAPVVRSSTRAWYPYQNPIRLDTAVAQATCTLLTVVPLRDPQMVRKQTADGTLVAWYNSVLATVVALVNAAGGAVHAVECSGVIVCVWNLMSATSAPASTALHVARALLATFDTIDMNIVTGSCMAANAKTGKRRNVVIVGAALEFAERVLLLNRMHCASITIDFDTFRDLSLQEQAVCRPIALLHNSPTSRVVLYSADWSAENPPPAKQRKDYMSAFGLYQNGMYEESINAFGQYLQQYPGDGSAEWIASYLLAHKLYPVESIVKANEVINADHGGAVLTMDDLAVWGGG